MEIENLTENEIKVLKHLRNFLVHTGEQPSFRKLMFLLGYQSPRSISLLFESLVKKKYLEKGTDGLYKIIKEIPEPEKRATTIEVPLVGSISCGQPLLATENIEAMYSMSTSLAKQPYKYFLLRASGNSMNLKGINNGNLLLIRQQETARNGETVVALINDEATLKEFKRMDNYIVLQPHSSEPEYKPIILTDDFRIQGIVVAVLPEII